MSPHDMLVLTHGGGGRIFPTHWKRRP